MKKSIFISLVIGVLICAASTINASSTATSASTTITSNSDDGWEYYSKVRVYGYNASTKKSTQDAMDACEVQRRMSCGEREYRIKIGSDWYPVNKNCPIEGFQYCVYYSHKVYCWNM